MCFVSIRFVLLLVTSRRMWSMVVLLRVRVPLRSRTMLGGVGCRVNLFSDWCMLCFLAIRCLVRVLRSADPFALFGLAMVMSAWVLEGLNLLVSVAMRLL